MIDLLVNSRIGVRRRLSKLAQKERETMIIARTVPSFYPRVTGPAKQVYNVSKRLEESGYHSTILTTTPHAESSWSPVDLRDLAVMRFPVSIRYMQFDASLAFSRAIFRLEFDLIHSHGYRDHLTAQSFIASKIRRRPFVLQPHGSLRGYRHILSRPKWKPYVYYDAVTAKRIAKIADRVVVSTAQEAEEAVSFGIEEEKIRIIPTGVSVRNHPSEETHGPSRMLFVGRISPSRNVHRIIEAFALASDGSELQLTIVGGEEKRSFSEKSGYLQHLMRLCERLQVDSKVTFTGPLYGRDLEKAYQGSDFFTYASSYENFGQTMLEAAAHGLPVISPRIGVARDIIIEGITGRYFDVNDIGRLSEIIGEFAENLEKVREMGKHMRELVKERYDWKRIIESYASLYEELV